MIIEIRTQAELDALTEVKVGEEVCIVGEGLVQTKNIQVRGFLKIAVNINQQNSSAVLWENASAVLWENASAVLWENASAVLWGNSSAVLWGNSSAVLRENASAVLWGNSSAELWGNSSAVLWENASAVLWGNACAELWGNAVGRIFSGAVTAILHAFSVCFISIDLKAKIKVKSKAAFVQRVKPQDWFEANGIKKTAKIVLFKRVSKDFETQEGTANKTIWAVGSVLEYQAWNPHKDECGEGKFHACSQPYFCDDFRSTAGDRYVAIEVLRKDTFAWKNPTYPHKIAFRKGKVLYECDRLGKKLEAKQ